MFINETHSFYIIAKISKPSNVSDGYLDRKLSIFHKALLNLDIEVFDGHDNIYILRDVMYSATDVFDIISSEMIRIVSTDTSIPASEKKLYELSSRIDSVTVSEYIQDNTYTL